ncbi:Protein ROG3 [Cyberlindnera fabianii]|uniref:Protein ROG3 n=1 Tax=Cyberlindnera fabianii TaxID=36022 RepID=A0A1V2L8N1_CYBFA|nr:Protein ROG3 [Cyberlindnera fabianii]
MIKTLTKALWALHDFIHPLGSIKLQLITSNESVVLKGISPAERMAASPVYLRGVLRVVIKRSKVPLDAINVQFIGECMNSVFQKQQGYRVLNKVKRHVIDETYRYTTGNGFLNKGVYLIPFQFIIDPTLPESAISPYFQRLYRLNVSLETKRTTHHHTIRHLKIVNIERSLADDSVYYNDNLCTSGTWHGILPHTISLSSRVCHLGGNIGVNIETFPDPTNNFAVVVKYLKVCLLQKTRCPELDKSGCPTGSFITFPTKKVLKYQQFDEGVDPYEPFKMNWDVELPSSSDSMQGYTSNLEPEETLHQDSVKVTHTLIVTVGLHSLMQPALSADTTVELEDELNVSTSTIESASSGNSNTSDKFVKLEEKGCEMSFRAPIFVVTGKTSIESPPLYTETSSDCYLPKSFTWLCSNGQFEVEHAPLYG